MLFTNAERGNFAKDPAVVRFGDGYFLYYTTPAPEIAPGAITVGIARSGDMEHWADVGTLPVTQDCEKNGIGAPAAIVLRGQVHLFYQTYGNWRRDAICHAVSDDGVHFAKDATNPVYRPSDDWCCGRAIDADVCVWGEELMLYIATRDENMEIQMLGAARARLDSDFSRDCWVQAIAAPILRPELPWEGKCIEAAATVVQGGEMFLFYGGSYNCTPQQIGCAVSRDGVHFERISDTPFLPCGAPGAFNASESGHPYAFRDDDGRVYLFYQGSPDGGRTWYLSRVEIGFEEGNRPRILG